MAKAADILLGAIVLAGGGYVLYNYQQQHVGQGARNLRLKIANVSLDQTDIIISVKIQNPNSEDMRVQSFVGEMYVNEKVVADIQMFGDYTAKGNSQVTIPLIARPKAQNLFQMLVQSFRQGVSRITYTGTINVNNTPMPITLTYNKTV